jgi:hypothetical protein
MHGAQGASGVRWRGIGEIFFGSLFQKSRAHVCRNEMNVSLLIYVNIASGAEMTFRLDFRGIMHYAAGCEISNNMQRRVYANPPSM